DHHRDAQSATGRARLRRDRVLLPRPVGGVWSNRADVPKPRERAHGSLYHREIRMSPADNTAIGFRHFHDQLAHLKQRLLDMSNLATSLLDLSVDALLARDANMAEAVLSGDREID